MITFMLFLFAGGIVFADIDKDKLMDLKASKIHFESKKNSVEKSKILFNEGLISKEEFEKDKLEFELSSIEYQRKYLKVLSETPHMSIKKALKYQDPQGKKRVKITLENSGDALPALTGLDLDKNVLENESKNIFVSLRDLQDIIISEPYEAKIGSLKINQKATLDFALLKDLEEVIIAINQDDHVVSHKIYLEKDSLHNFVSINSLQFSQEADLGNQATYDLSLERFSQENSHFKLLILNLPKQITYEFKDTQSDAKLSQIKFIDGLNSSKISLVLYLPSISDNAVALDSSIKFYAAAVPTQNAHLINLEKQNSPEEILKFGGGFAFLELVPRGIGKLELITQNLFHEIDKGTNAEFTVSVKNSGTKTLNNIRILTDLPYKWKSEITPELILMLEENKEHEIKLKILPDPDVSVGTFEFKIRTESFANNKKVESEDKIIRININAKTNYGAILALLFLLAGIVGVTVYFGIKLARK